jgi:thiol-disulfide isomerase/thioredoxin
MEKMMKYINLIIAVIIAIAMFSCDVVDPPYLKKGGNEPIDTSETVQKVLIEDFTGMKCGNCPEAADLAHEIADVYPGKIIVLAIHSGWYAMPNQDFTYDFRTETGNAIDKYFKVSDAGNPNGMVNRTKKDGSRIISPAGWASVAGEIINSEPMMSIEIAAEYEESAREISVEAAVEYLENGSPKHRICVFIAEDSIVAPQQDDRLVPPVDEDYVHNHVLRESMNGVWGEKLSDIEIAAGEKFTKNYTYKISADSDWKPRHLKIIAFVHDYGDSFEILQAEEAHLIE